MTAEHKLPTWILIVSGLFALMEIGVSLSMCFAPDSMADKVDLGAKGVVFLINMWAVRQFALGFIFAFATIRKSAPMLTISYLFFLVMFVGDLLVGFSLTDNTLIISGLIMCAISAALLFAINRKK